jgi:hypothetical protein
MFEDKNDIDMGRLNIYIYFNGDLMAI